MSKAAAAEESRIRQLSPSPTFRQEWLIRSCRKWNIGDMRRRYWTLAHAARISPALDRIRLHRSFRELLINNPLLRWCFHGFGDDVFIRVLSPDSIVVEDVDVASKSVDEVRALIEARALELIEPEGGPLVALTVYHAETATVLLLRFHHVLVDGWSVMVLVRELVESYISGGTHNARKTGNFCDFVRWQRNFIETDRGKRQLSFWLGHLSDLPPPLRLPYNRPDDGSFTTGTYVSRSITASHAARLPEFAASTGAAPFRVLLAAFNITIFTMTGTSDAPVATAVANRLRRDLRHTIGWIANNVYFRTAIELGDDVQGYCRSVAQTTDLVLENQEYPISLVEDLIARDFPNLASALDQISFGVDMPHHSDQSGIGELLFRAGSTPIAWGNFTFEPIELPSIECNRDLTLIAKFRSDIAGPSTLDLSLNYRGDVFERNTAERILELYEATIELMVGDPRACIFRLVDLLRSRFPDLAAGAR